MFSNNKFLNPIFLRNIFLKIDTWLNKPSTNIQAKGKKCITI